MLTFVVKGNDWAQWPWSLTGKGKAAFVIGRAQFLAVNAERVELADQGDRLRIRKGCDLQVVRDKQRKAGVVCNLGEVDIGV